MAIILRFGELVKDLFILEAVGDRGVRITSWLNIRSELYPGGFFEKIMTRKLLFEMTSERLADLDQFRRNCVGKQYGLTARKLLFNQSSETDLHKKSDGEIGAGGGHKEIKDDRKFFCSELIAKAFKVLDVMQNPDKKGSNNYYPCSFDRGSTIDADLKDDVALGPPLNILVHGMEELHQNGNLQMQRHSDYVEPFSQPVLRQDMPEFLLRESHLNCFI